MYGLFQPGGMFVGMAWNLPFSGASERYFIMVGSDLTQKTLDQA